MAKKTPKDFAEYADAFPNKVQRMLRAMRMAIKKAAPKAEETISYGIPAFGSGKLRVWFGGHKTHIGFYPGASTLVTFRKELSTFKSAKGSVQFPFDRPLPLALVARMVKFRMKETSKNK